MIKRTVQKIKNGKIEKLENFFQSGYQMKKSRLRAFARTRAKNYQPHPYCATQCKRRTNFLN